MPQQRAPRSNWSNNNAQRTRATLALRSLAAFPANLSTHIPPTVHIDRVPSDVAILSQHHGHVGNFIHRAESPNGDEIETGLGIARDHLRLDQRRGDGVHRDPFLGEQVRIGVRQPENPLGERLAETGDLYRQADNTIGLLRVLDDGDYREITTAKALAPVIVDRIPVEVIKDGKIKGSRIANAHLDAMLQADVFLQRFRRVDMRTPENSTRPSE